MSINPRTRRQAGLTLIEVLIVSPMIILLIGVAIAFIIALTGDAVQVQEKNTMAYNVQDVLDDIEADVRTSIRFEAKTGKPANPQGSNNVTAEWYNVDEVNPTTKPETLILRSSTTNTNPFDPSRSLVYSGGSPCNDNNELFLHLTIYFVRGGTLYKRTILDKSDNCTTVYQRGSCLASLVASYSVCQAADEELLKNVTGFTISYGGTNPAGEDDVPIPDTNVSDPGYQADTAVITITTSKEAGGATISYSGMIRARIASL